MRLRTALMTACAVALPLAAAFAAQPARDGIVIYDVFGHPIGVLRPLPAAQDQAAAVATGDPGLRMIREMIPDFGAMDAAFAQQDAIMQRMMARMDALAAAPLENLSNVGALPSGATRIVISTYSSGRGSCTQTISYGAAAPGTQPQVVTQTVGNGCAPGGVMGGASDGGAGTRTIPTSEPQATPAPAQPGTVTQPPSPGGARVYHINAQLPANAYATPAYHG